jgi:hypothetical protein
LNPGPVAFRGIGPGSSTEPGTFLQQSVARVFQGSDRSSGAIPG